LHSLSPRWVVGPPGPRVASVVSLHQPMDQDLRSPHRLLIELRIEHADLDSLIDQATGQPAIDELTLRRLKKRRLALRDQIALLEMQALPPEPA
jgi:hypothetical protein